MATNYKQPGKVITYTAGADIVAGAVVKMGNILGVALNDIANGEEGEVAIDGVWELPKVSGAVIGQGQSLVWDVSAGAFDDNLATPAAGDVSGAASFAFEAAGNGVATLLVKLTGTPGTVT